MDLRLPILATGAALAIAGCGGAGHSGAPAAGASRAVANPPPFAWLAPGPAGAAWTVVRLPSGATLTRPPGWQAVRSDPGTASFAVRDSRHAIVAYLNATPRQGAESLGNWAGFRIHHNAEEGSKAITLALYDLGSPCVIRLQVAPPSVVRKIPAPVAANTAPVLRGWTAT